MAAPQAGADRLPVDGGHGRRRWAAAAQAWADGRRRLAEGRCDGWHGAAGMSDDGRPAASAVMPEGRRTRPPVSLARALVAAATELAIRDKNPKSKLIHKKLEEPISMSFLDETPLEDVLKYIKQATTTKKYGEIPIYVDPDGLVEADKTMASTVRNIDLEGIPLKTTLRLMLKQLGLAYCVRDGVLIISSPQGIFDELKEARRELDLEEDLGAKQDEDEAGKPGEERREGREIKPAPRAGAARVTHSTSVGPSEVPLGSAAWSRAARSRRSSPAPGGR